MANEGVNGTGGEVGGGGGGRVDERGWGKVGVEKKGW